jgi:hypothetical protein
MAAVRGWYAARDVSWPVRRLGAALARGWGHVAREPRRGWARETVARSAMLTVAALIWFALVPVPAFVSFQVLQYRATLDTDWLAAYLPAVAAFVGLVLASGWLSIIITWAVLNRRYRRAHLRYRERFRAGGVCRTMAATIEAAFEGYRVAADTRSPVLAARYLMAAVTALEHAQSPGRYFGPDLD